VRCFPAGAMSSSEDNTLAVPLQTCSSCRVMRPINEFSGKATCDRCRSKKRKSWEDKQVKMDDLQAENSSLRQQLSSASMKNSQLITLVQNQAQEILRMQFEMQCHSVFFPHQDRQALSTAVWAPSTANNHPAAPTSQVKSEVDNYAQLQDGSLIDFAFQSASLLANSSSYEYFPEQTCSNGGSGSGCSAAQFAELDNKPSLTNSHYIRSLDYGISFEDPQLNQVFQSSMTKRMEKLWVGIFLCLALACYSESSISYFYPAAYPFVASTGWLLTYALMMSALTVGLACYTNQTTYGAPTLPGVESTSHGEYYRAKLLGEFAFYLTGLRHLFWINRFYAEEPATVEDYTFVAFVLCTRTLVVAWAEISPLGAAASTLPLWVAFLAQPEMSLVFQTRVCVTAGFCMWLAFVIYQNNREIFVTQVKLQHAHLITAELKQKQGENCAKITRFDQDLVFKLAL